MSNPGSGLQRLGAGMMGCGCLIMLVPILVILVLGVLAVVTSSL